MDRIRASTCRSTSTAGCLVELTPGRKTPMTSAIRSSGPLAALVLMLVACSGSSTASPSGGTSGPDDPPRTQAPASVEPSMAPPSRSAKAEDGAFEVTVNGLAVRGHCTGDRVPGEPVVILQSGNGGGEDDLSGIEEHM